MRRFRIRQLSLWMGFGRFGFACAILCVTSLARPVFAELIENGGFELPEVANPFEQRNVGNAFAGWTVDSGTIDHVRNFWQAKEGLQSMELNGPNAGGIAQDVATTPGVTYKLRFAMAGNPFGVDDKRLEILWDGVQIADITFDQAGQTAVDMGYIYHEVNAVALDSSTRLVFHSLTGPMNGSQGFTEFYGPVIDDVTLTAVPEPASCMLTVISGLAGIACCLRRKRR